MYNVALIINMSDPTKSNEGLNINEKKLKKTAIENTIEIILNLNSLILFLTLKRANLKEFILFTPTK